MLGLALPIAPGTANAGQGDGVTIGDVAAMEPHKAIKYVHHEASKRGLELGRKYGDTVLNCLKAEFVTLKPDGNGSHILPRGLTAAIRLVHRHNNNGGSSLSAVDQIREIVDLVGHHACGLPKP